MIPAAAADDEFLVRLRVATVSSRTRLASAPTTLRYQHCFAAIEVLPLHERESKTYSAFEHEHWSDTVAPQTTSMTRSAIVSESSVDKDVLMAFPPENDASSTRVSPLSRTDSLLEFSAEGDRTPVGPARTDRHRHKSTSSASGAWHPPTGEVAGDGRWFKDLQRLRSGALGRSSRLRRSPGIISESPTAAEALMAFVPEDKSSSTRLTPLPQSDPLLEFSFEEDRTPVDADRQPNSTSWASEARPASMSEVVLDATRCLTWMSTCMATLKVGPYERAVGLYARAGSLAVAVRMRSHALNRRLRLALCFVRAMLSALVMRGYAFTSEVARDGRRCLTWLSTRQADLKVGLDKTAVGLYKTAVGLYETAVDVHERAVGLSNIADSFAVAVRARSHSMDRHLKLALRSARATLNAMVTRGSAFTSRRTSYTRRALIPFVYGVAAGVFVTLFLPAQSIPGATMRSVVPSVRPPANARAVGAGVQQMVATAGRGESDQTSAVSSSRPSIASPRNAPSTQRAASPKLAGYRGSLAVNSAPTGARVLVNGVPVGKTPLLLQDLPVGSRVVRLELDGYERWSSAVRVVANERVSTAVDLRPSPSNN